MSKKSKKQKVIKKSFQNQLSNQLSNIKTQKTENKTKRSNLKEIQAFKQIAAKAEQGQHSFEQAFQTEQSQQHLELQEKYQQLEKRFKQQKNLSSQYKKQLEKLKEEVKESNLKLQKKTKDYVKQQIQKKALQKENQEQRQSIQDSKEQLQKAYTQREEAKKQVQKIQQQTLSSNLLELFLAQGVTENDALQSFLQLLEKNPSKVFSKIELPKKQIKRVSACFSFICSREDCKKQAEHHNNKTIIVKVKEQKSCEVCEGSNNQRALQQMFSFCRQHHKMKILVVGGSPDTHAELSRLWQKPFELKLVAGSDNRRKQQATEDLKGNDLVIVWGSTILPHKVAWLYTKQKALTTEKVVYVPKRGIVALANEVITFLKRREEEGSLLLVSQFKK